MTVFSPKTAEELADIILASKVPLEIVGSGSKSKLGMPTEIENKLSLSAFSGVIAYEPEELIIEAGAATPVEDVEKLLSANQQMLAFEPPHYKQFLSGADKGTLGGLLACNLSGSRRLTAGAARDHILGVSGVDGRGTIFKGGGRVVKNVTGYDMPKLLAGSYGTLASVTSVVFKVLPKPETEVTLIVPVVAPVGTVAVICVVESTRKTALVPLNETTDAELKLVPVMTTELFTTPLMGEKLEITGAGGLVRPSIRAR